MSNAKYMSENDKRKMLTAIREASQGFRKDLDISRDTVTDLAGLAKYAYFDAIVNKALGLYEGIAESVDILDDTLNQMCELWIKQGTATAEFETFAKKFYDDRVSLKVEYDTVSTDDGNQAYDSELHGTPFKDEIDRVLGKRRELLEKIKDEHKDHAGVDIADMIVPAFKKIEDSCNEFVVELQKAVEDQASMDSRLNSLAAGIGELASQMKTADMGEAKKKKFGSVDNSKYIDL